MSIAGLTSGSSAVNKMPLADKSNCLSNPMEGGTATGFTSLVLLRALMGPESASLYEPLESFLSSVVYHIVSRSAV